MMLQRDMGQTSKERHPTGVVLTAEGDPSSIAAYCTDRYTACPIWVGEKHRVWARRKKLRSADSGA